MYERTDLALLFVLSYGHDVFSYIWPYKMCVCNHLITTVEMYLYNKDTVETKLSQSQINTIADQGKGGVGGWVFSYNALCIQVNF